MAYPIVTGYDDSPVSPDAKEYFPNLTLTPPMGELVRMIGNEREWGPPPPPLPPPPPSVNFNARQSQLIKCRRGELVSLTTGRPAFAKFTGADIVDTADIFVRNGVPSKSDIKNIRAESREVPIDDMREEGYKLMDIQLLMGMLHLAHPLISEQSDRLRKFGEWKSPKKMRWWEADLGRLESFIKPDRLMANGIPDQISRAKAAHPPVYAVFYILFCRPP